MNIVDLMKYIGIELGTRTAEQEPYVVPGGYSAESLAKVLSYISAPRALLTYSNSSWTVSSPSTSSAKQIVTPKLQSVSPRRARLD
jgi:hypothetical protein